MAVSAANVKAFAPVFASVSDGIIDTWLGWAPTALAASVFGAKHDQAVMLWVCHCLTVTGGDGSDAGSSGPVRSRKVGDVSVDWGERVFRELSDPASYATTAYGQALMRLIRLFTAAPTCV